jgi:hypothetical protein
VLLHGALVLHCNNGHANALRCYTIGIWLIWFSVYPLTPHLQCYSEAYCFDSSFHYSSVMKLTWHVHSSFKANSHIPCRSHAVPLSCRAVKGLDCVFPIWFTQCGRVWFTHAMPCRARAMPRPCHATPTPFWKRPIKAKAQRSMGAACVN